MCCPIGTCGPSAGSVRTASWRGARCPVARWYDRSAASLASHASSPGSLTIPASGASSSSLRCGSSSPTRSVLRCWCTHRPSGKSLVTPTSTSVSYGTAYRPVIPFFLRQRRSAS
jgi:hypothetical protein